MKTSNKILLGVFLLCVLTILGVHVALYAKYKAGDFASKDEINGRIYHEQELPPTLKAVSITGLGNCNIKNGKASLKYNKEGNVQLTVTIKNDTLYLAANDWAKKEDYEEGTRNHQIVNLSLPANLPVTCQYGDVFLMGAADSAQAPSFNLDMGRHTHLGLVDWESKTPIYFNKVQVVANDASMKLSSQAVINEMTVKSANSYLDYKHSIIKQHSLEMDDKTTIVVTQKNLNNINLTPKQ
jgi:hypothetical protein